MAGDWFPLLMLFGLTAIAAGAAFTIRQGAVGYLFLDLRRDENPIEFWVAVIVTTASAAGLLYALLA